MQKKLLPVRSFIENDDGITWQALPLDTPNKNVSIYLGSNGLLRFHIKRLDFLLYLDEDNAPIHYPTNDVLIDPKGKKVRLAWVGSRILSNGLISITPGISKTYQDAAAWAKWNADIEALGLTWSPHFFFEYTPTA